MVPALLGDAGASVANTVWKVATVDPLGGNEDVIFGVLGSALHYPVMVFSLSLVGVSAAIGLLVRFVRRALS